MFFKIIARKNVANFTGKHLCWSLEACNFIEKRLQQRCFLLELAKILRTPFFKEHHRIDAFVHIVHT